MRSDPFRPMIVARAHHHMVVGIRPQ
jgi:hypothetical protein